MFDENFLKQCLDVKIDYNFLGNDIELKPNKWTDAVRDKLIIKLKKLFGNNSDKYVNRDSMDYFTYTSFITPDCPNSDECELILLYMIFGYHFDDVYSENPEKFKQFIPIASEKHYKFDDTMATGLPKLYTYIMSEFEKRMSKTLFNRYHNKMFEWMTTCADIKTLHLSTESLTLEKFMDIRLLDSGTKTLWILNEFSARFQLETLTADTVVAADPTVGRQLKAFEWYGGVVPLLINDITSFKKEAKTNDLNLNYIYLIALRDQLSPQQAMDNVIALIKDQIWPTLNKIKDQLLMANTRLNIPNLDIYVNELFKAVAYAAIRLLSSQSSEMLDTNCLTLELVGCRHFAPQYIVVYCNDIELQANKWTDAVRDKVITKLMGLFGTNADKYLTRDSVDFITYFGFISPDSPNSDEYELVILYMIFGFYFNDVYAENPEKFSQFLPVISEKHYVFDDTLPTSLAKLYIYIMSEFEKLMSKSMFNRFHRKVVEWLTICADIKTFHLSTESVTLEKFMETRIPESGTKTLWILNEFSARFQLDSLTAETQVTTDPSVGQQLKTFEWYASVIPLLINDITSFKKEAKTNDLNLNYIYLIVLRDQLSPQQAIDNVIAIIRDHFWPTIIKLMDQLLLANTRLNIPNLDKYVNELFKPN
ncbi:uncharacterized protein LOC128956728 [Oppia nitens]|uniref:uncharacterized protein LOC128956728 n=1 Tax=Oppia nitens TaxID=1686743 RepID=UPI0023DA5BEB|nr:uncharacterized protein LOC128956728 [Oppia nitens]